MLKTFFGLYILATFLTSMFMFARFTDTEEGRKLGYWVTGLWFFGNVNILGFGVYFYMGL